MHADGLGSSNKSRPWGPAGPFEKWANGQTRRVLEGYLGIPRRKPGEGWCVGPLISSLLTTYSDRTQDKQVQDVRAPDHMQASPHALDCVCLSSLPRSKKSAGSCCSLIGLGISLSLPGGPNKLAPGSSKDDPSVNVEGARAESLMAHHASLRPPIHGSTWQNQDAIHTPSGRRADTTHPTCSCVVNPSKGRTTLAQSSSETWPTGHD